MPQRSGLDRLGLKVKEAQELTRFRVQCEPGTFGREGNERRRQMPARPGSDVRQLGGLAYALVCYVVSMYRKLLDQAVEFR